MYGLLVKQSMPEDNFVGALEMKVGKRRKLLLQNLGNDEPREQYEKDDIL